MNKKLFSLCCIALLLFITACTSTTTDVNQIESKPIDSVSEATEQQTTPSAAMPVQGTTADELNEAVAENVVFIDIKGFAYSEPVLMVKKGTTVTWTNQDSVKHNVAFDTGDVTAPLLAKGESFSYTFDEVGTYAYHCTPHPNMKARVVVE